MKKIAILILALLILFAVIHNGRSQQAVGTLTIDAPIPEKIKQLLTP